RLSSSSITSRSPARATTGPCSPPKKCSRLSQGLILLCISSLYYWEFNTSGEGEIGAAFNVSPVIARTIICHTSKKYLKSEQIKYNLKLLTLLPDPFSQCPFYAIL